MLVQQGNETIILSTYNGEETVREDREDGEDLDESTTEVLIFVDTLLKSLKSSARKGKTKWKWPSTHVMLFQGNPYVCNAIKVTGDSFIIHKLEYY